MTNAPIAPETDPPPLSLETIRIVKSTQPVLEQHGVAITTLFYKKLFQQYPATKALFGSADPGQEDRLAAAVLAYSANIDNLEALLPVVAKIAEKHVEAGVQADHYPIVGNLLLASMVEVLGEVDAIILDAWAEAYEFLANVFIETEALLMAEAAA